MKVTTSFGLEVPLMKTLNEIAIKTKDGQKGKVIVEALVKFIESNEEYNKIYEKYLQEQAHEVML